MLSHLRKHLRALAYCVTLAATASAAIAALTLTASQAQAQTAPASIATTTALTTTALTPTAGQSVVLMASVKPKTTTGTTSTSTVSGNVTFKDGATVLGSAALDATGTARLNATLPTAGLRTLTATYAATSTATASYQASTSAPLALAVLGTSGPLHAAPASTAPQVSYGYDATDNLTRITNAPANASLAQTTTIAYDKLQRPVIITDPAQGNTQVEYSPSHTPLAVQDPRGLITRYPGDTLGQPASLQSPDSGTSAYRYDSAGNLTQRTDARGLVTTYTYDALNRLTQARHTPPANSLAASNTTPTPITRSWAYDQPPAATAGFSTNGIGRLTSQTHPAGQTHYAYDPQGRLVAHRQTLQPIAAIAGNTSAQPSAITSTVRYTYNSAGNPTSVTYPSGRVISITYANGLPSAINIAAPSGAVTPVISGLTYTPDGQAQRWQWHLQTATGTAGTTTTTTTTHQRSYDPQGRLTRLPLGNLIRDIHYDAAGRISQFTHHLVTGSTTAARHAAYDHSYSYDKLDRLTSARISNADTPASTATTTYNYQWDANGNRTSQTTTASPPTAATPTTATRQLSNAATSNRLQTLTNPATTLVHNSAGLITNDSTGFNLEYDASDSFSSLGNIRTPDGQRISYHYDNNALRVRKAGAAGTTSATAANTRIFVYDAGPAGQGVTGSYPRLLGEYDGNGQAVREYIWLADIPLALIPGNPNTATKAYPIHADHLNTPRVVLDEQGRTRWVWNGEPFGASAPQEDPQGLGALEQPLRFAGQYADKETGLFANHYRYYSPSLGRYVQTDPIGLEGGINTFAYVEGNPLNAIDPDGLQQRVVTTYTITYSGSAATLRVNNLINQIRSYNPDYTYQTIQPYSRTGVQYTNADVSALTSILRGYRNQEVCTRGGVPVGRFISDQRGNTMIEPVGGRTTTFQETGRDVHTVYQNGSNYMRLNPYGHGPNGTPHGHGHAPGPGPRANVKGQGPSLDINGNKVPWNSPAAHWPIY